MADDDPKTASPAPNMGVKKGLPARSLKDAEDAAGSVWGVARRGMAAKDAVAKALGLRKASGGTWDAYLALLRGFGLVEVKDEEVGLSELGLQIVQDADPSKRQDARRAAFLHLRAYRELVDDYDETELPEVVSIGSKLRYEYGKTEEMALQAANAFVESLRHAGLLDGTVVRKATAEATLPPVQPAGSGTLKDVSSIDESETDVEDALDAAWDEEFEEGQREDLMSRSSGDISLAMTLDLSTYRSDEVIEILTALGLARRR